MRITMIRLSKETVEELKKLGTKGETYDQIVRRLIDHYKKFSGR